jgi:hypothetical protein
LPGGDVPTDADIESRVELPDGRVLAFRGEGTVARNLAEARRLARRGVRARDQAIAELYHRDDGVWEIIDPEKELDLMSDLSGAILFSYAAIEAIADPAVVRIGDPDALGETWLRLCSLHDGLVGGHPGIFGRLMRGDADTCAEDAIALVRGLRPGLLPSVIEERQRPRRRRR